MKKLIAILLCVLVLFSAVSVTCFAEYPVEGRDEPSVETAVENTIGKYIPTGKVVADNFFNVLDAIRSALNQARDFYLELIDRVSQGFSSFTPFWKK